MIALETCKESLVSISVYLTPLSFTACQPNDSSETLIDTCMKKVMDYFYPGRIIHNQNQNLFQKNFDTGELYQILTPTLNEMISPPCELLPNLRPYQLKAAHWMINQEKNEKKTSFPHPLWVECKAEGNNRFYCNRWNGKLSEKPFTVEVGVKGGILADEMGLGKTLEVLCCILAHKKIDIQFHFEEPQLREKVECLCGSTDDDSLLWVQCDACKTWFHAQCVEFDSELDRDNQYYCESCLSFTNQPPIDSHGTLIICPVAILHQWKNEIEKHVVPNSLKILIYEGTKNKLLLPKDLLQYDIVLTTYEVLRTDLYHIVDSEKEYNLRYSKKYKKIPTPLVKINWWRLCLDGKNFFNLFLKRRMSNG